MNYSLLNSSGQGSVMLYSSFHQWTKFGDEKFLNSTEGKSFLNKNKILIYMLNVYKSAEIWRRKKNTEFFCLYGRGWYNRYSWYSDILILRWHDASGIDIFYKLKNAYKAYQICPFEPGYQYLYEHKNFKRKKEMKNTTRIPGYEIIPFDFPGSEARVELLDLCNHDYIIPQEILNNGVLMMWDRVSGFEADNFMIE